ncbi:MAG: hypothetical protein QJR01_00920 [Kyrpidia sp.]|nr:hypothetical protein [Kyrpidia sp.]
MKRSGGVFLAVVMGLLASAGAGLWYAENQTLAARPEVQSLGQSLVQSGLLTRIDRVDFYGAGPAFYVFTGEDDTGKPAYVWVQGGRPILKRYVEEGLTADQAWRAAQAAQPAPAQLIHAVPGLTEPGASGPGDPPGSGTERRVLWELFGMTGNGLYEYVYVDWETGAVVRTYLLQS